MKVHALARIVVETEKDRFANAKNVAVISIIDSEAEPVFQNDTDNIITLRFDDIHPTTTMTLASCMDFKAMDMNDAKKIVRFVRQILAFNEHTTGTKIDTIVVHCTAGICRSGAVVDFLRVVLDVHDLWFVQHNNHIIPNEWVRDLLWMTWKMKGTI